MDVPTFDQLLNPTLTALHNLGGSASTTELLEQLVEDLQLSPEVVEQPHTGKGNRTKLEYRLAWSRTYLKKYGSVTNSTRGVRALAPKGVGTGKVDPQAVVRFVREQDARERTGQAKPVEPVAPEDSLRPKKLLPGARRSWPRF